MQIAETANRVSRNTPQQVNRKIKAKADRSVAYYERHPDEIKARLKALDREWDIERLLEANASTLMLLGVGLGLGVSRKLFAIPVVVSSFLLQHAIQGWCPPVPIFRRLGFRTQSEIEAERHALLHTEQVSSKSARRKERRSSSH